MEDGSRSFGDLFTVALPSVPKAPLRTLPRSLYRHLFDISGAQQFRLCIPTFLAFPLSMAPLELRRRFIDNAIEGPDLRLLLLLGAQAVT